jgi:hypothetical protein
MYFFGWQNVNVNLALYTSYIASLIYEKHFFYTFFLKIVPAQD